MALTAVYIQDSEGFIGFVGELPEVNAQEATLDEARVNPQEAVAMVTEANREFVEESLRNGRTAAIQRLRRFERLCNSSN